MAGTLTLTFNNQPDIDDLLNIFINNGVQEFTLFEVFKSVRNTANQSTLSLENVVEDTAAFFALAFNLDYSSFGGAGNLSAVVTSTQVTLSLAGDSWTFVSVSGTAITGGHISHTIVNEPVTAPIINTNTLTGSPSPLQCSQVAINLSTSGGTAPYRLKFNGVDSPGTYTSTKLQVATRGLTAQLEISDSSTPERSITQNVQVPRSLQDSDFDINILNSPSGSTVTVNFIATVANIGSLEYSLDGTTYQSSNSFPSLTAGTYSVSIRDRFLCVTAIPFIIDDTSPVQLEPFFLVAEANSLRFFRDEEDTASIRANYENRKSCREVVRGIAYDNVIHFENDDIIPTQFKTNHDDIEVKSIDGLGNETIIPALTTVTNVGLQDRRDCRYFSISNDNIGVYFTNGNTYNYDTGAVTGTYTQINNTLPLFIDVGSFITVQGLGYKEVLATEFDRTRQVWFARVTGFLDSSIADITTQCLTVYNQQPYNVYQFDTVMSNYLNNEFQIQITTDQVTYRSETIRVSSNVKGVVIDYRNTENKFNMVYSNFDFISRLRLPQMDIPKLVLDDEIENYNSDNAPIQLDTKLYKNFELRCEFLSSAMAFKLLIALHHNVVNVNGLPMVLKEISTFENLENTNLYAIRAIMIQGGNAAEMQRESIVNLTTLAALKFSDVGLLNIRL